MSSDIVHEGRVLAQVVRAADALPDKTTFITAASAPLQVGYIVYRNGDEVPRHVHTRVPRALDVTAEVIFVQRGRCALDVYSAARALVVTVELAAGDVVILLEGGHGFRMQEDTVLLEVKQGPYFGVDEKVRF